MWENIFYLLPFPNNFRFQVDRISELVVSTLIFITYYLDIKRNTL